MEKFVVRSEEYAAYQAGTPSPQVAEIVAWVAQGAEIDVCGLDDFRDRICGWY